MPAFIDFTGRRIGRVNILENTERGFNSRWKCLCDCGREFECLHRSFKRGDMFECEDCRFERRRGIDLTGRKYGRWTVIHRDVNELNKTVWVVQCDCGVMGKVATYALGRPGKSMSCGCLGRKERSKYVNETLYPPCHRKSLTYIYDIRTRIVHACYKETHPSYKFYGAKGYTVCELWRNGALDFYNWCIENGWDRGHVVGIKDGEKVYCPENCYIMPEGEHISMRLQKRVTYEGVTKTLREWAEHSQVSYKSIGTRLCKGYTVEEAIFSKPYQFSGSFKDFPDEEIKRLYETGMSMADVGRELGLNYVTVGTRLKLMGINPDKKGRRKYKPIVCYACQRTFVPTNSNHKKCSECKLSTGQKGQCPPNVPCPQVLSVPSCH